MSCAELGKSYAKNRFSAGSNGVPVSSCHVGDWSRRISWWQTCKDSTSDGDSFNFWSISNNLKTKQTNRQTLSVNLWRKKEFVLLASHLRLQDCRQCTNAFIKQRRHSVYVYIQGKNHQVCSHPWFQGLIGIC